MEQFDIVDKNDQVIGTTDKKTAHETGQLHRVAAVFVFNQAGELYVQEHPRDGKWDHSVGGHVRKGESYAVAAAREAQEELGITQPLQELATSLSGVEYANEQHLFGLYSCVAEPGWKFVPNDEVKVIFPMSIAAIRQAMLDEPEERFTRGFRITMAEYVRQNLTTSVIVEARNQHIHKFATNAHGRHRLARELEVFEQLKDSAHIPTIVPSGKAEATTIDTQKIQGQSLRKLLGVEVGYAPKPLPWHEAKKWLKLYVDAEMDLLERGALYRDLNLDHLIFTDDKAVFVDLESTIISEYPGKWVLKDMRGTWETMAPEEFVGYGVLSARTATYRAAVIAHLMLTGKLPFKRYEHSRSATHHWRVAHTPEVDSRFSKETRRVFAAALARKPVHRHKDPLTFYRKLFL